MSSSCSAVREYLLLHTKLPVFCRRGHDLQQKLFFLCWLAESGMLGPAEPNWCHHTWLQPFPAPVCGWGCSFCLEWWREGILWLWVALQRAEAPWAVTAPVQSLCQGLIFAFCCSSVAAGLQSLKWLPGNAGLLGAVPGLHLGQALHPWP